MENEDYLKLSQGLNLKKIKKNLIMMMIFDTLLASTILLVYLYSVVGMTYFQLQKALLGFLWIAPLTMILYSFIVFLYFRPVIEFLKRFHSHEATDRFTIINAQSRIQKGPPAVSLAGLLFWSIGAFLMAVWMINEGGISQEKGVLLVLGGVIAAFATNSHSLYRLNKMIRPFARLLYQQSQASKGVFKEATSSIKRRFHINLLSLIIFSLFFSYLTIFSETLFLMNAQTKIHLKSKVTEMSQTIQRFLARGNVEEIVPFIDNITLGKNGYAFLIDTSGGQVVTSHINAELYRFLKKSIFHVKNVQFSEYGPKNLIVAYGPVKGSAFYIGVVSNKNQYIPNLKKFVITSVLVILICIILSLAMAIASSEDIVEPINELINEVSLISGGELDHPIYTEGSDEIAVLANTFEKMRLSLKTQMEEKSKKVKELTTLYEMGQQLEKARNVEAKFNILLTNVVYKLNYDRAVLFKVNEDGTKLVGAEIRGNNPTNLNPNELIFSFTQDNEIIIQSLKSKSTLLIEDAFNDSRVSEGMNQLFQSKSFITIPFFITQKPLGVLVVDNNTTERIFTPEDMRILSIITNQVIASIRAFRN